MQSLLIMYGLMGNPDDQRYLAVMCHLLDVAFNLPGVQNTYAGAASACACEVMRQAKTRPSVWINAAR